MSSNPMVTLVLVTHNSALRLYDCIVSILNSTYADYELLIVNNGDFPLDDLIGGAFADKRIKILNPGKNLGYAGGVNHGGMQANGEILIIVNDDIVLHPQYIENVAAFMTENTCVTMVSSKVFLMRHYRIINSTGQAFSCSLKPLNIGDGEADSGKYDKSRPVFAASGPVFAVRREIFTGLNGFSENYFLGYEDIDFFWRACLAGFECRYLPKAVAYHYRNESIQTIPARMLYYSIRNRIITLALNHSFFSLLIALPFICFYNLKFHYSPRFLESRLQGVYDALKYISSQKRKAGLPLKKSPFSLLKKMYRA